VTIEARETAFLAFARELEPPLRAALVARFGWTGGREAAAEALAWSWEHWDRLDGVDNRAGYLYRIGCRRATRWRWTRPVHADGAPEPGRWVEPKLASALASLTVAQRQAVLLVEGYGLTYAEAAEVLGVGRSTVQVHVARGLRHLRDELGVTSDV
jgi:DNA-directed RNA polymerase specialized sigma24 family protein